MQRILFGILFLIIVSVSISISASSSNINYNNLYQTSGGAALPATMTTFVIVDGPGAGTQLGSTTDATTGMVIVDAMAGNQITNADGHIGGIGVGEGMNCPGPLGHYHGTLRGQPDPDPEKCGWGHVAALNDISEGTQEVSANYMREVSIIQFIEKEPPDYNGAANAADEAAMELSMLQDDIRDPDKTMIGKGMAHQASDKLGKAINADKFVVMTLSPLPPKRDSEKDAAITLKINNALKAKQEALMILFDAEAMAAAMAGIGE